jgi:hypothetical protein
MPNSRGVRSNYFCVLAATKFCKKLKFVGSVPEARVNPVSEVQKKRKEKKRQKEMGEKIRQLLNWPLSGTIQRLTCAQRSSVLSIPMC